MCVNTVVSSVQCTLINIGFMRVSSVQSQKLSPVDLDRSVGFLQVEGFKICGKSVRG